MVTFIANILLLKKIARLARSNPGVFMVRVANGSIWQSPWRSLSKQMVEKIDTEQGRRIYPQRLAIVEPVFANIRINKRLDRFTLRGKIKVNIQWLMYCLVHNIEKILNYGMASCVKLKVDETQRGHKDKRRSGISIAAKIFS